MWRQKEKAAHDAVVEGKLREGKMRKKIPTRTEICRVKTIRTAAESHGKGDLTWLPLRRRHGPRVETGFENNVLDLRQGTQMDF